MFERSLLSDHYRKAFGDCVPDSDDQSERERMQAERDRMHDQREKERTRQRELNQAQRAAAAQQKQEKEAEKTATIEEMRAGEAEARAGEAGARAAEAKARADEATAMPAARGAAGINCTAHFKHDKPCCGQDVADRREPQDVRKCPPEAPECFGYVFGKHPGSCMTATEKAEALRANEEKAEVIQAARKAVAEKVEADRAAEAAWAAAEKAAAHKKQASESAATAQAASTSASAAARGWMPQPPSPSSPPFAPPDETVLLNPKLNVLHVRRRDTKDKCDTTVHAVLEYMRCPASRWNESTYDKLVLFTDETSPNYLNALTYALSELPRWGGGVVHGDRSIVQELGPEDQTDNFLVYSVASLLMSQADELYAMERCHGTRTCDTATEVARGDLESEEI